MNCGPTCLRIIANFYGRDISSAHISTLAGTGQKGTSLLSLSEVAEKIGMKSTAVKISKSEFEAGIKLPCIAHWNQKHYVVVYRIASGFFYTSDPAHGLVKYTEKEFMNFWLRDELERGVVLILEPTSEFYSNNGPEVQNRSKLGITLMLNYFKAHRRQLFVLGTGLFVGSLLQLIFPFLTQSVVDIGIANHDLSFIYLVLFAQLMLFFGRMTIEIVRGFLLMHISSRVNITLVSDFFRKLMNLPISFFDTKMTGDIMQRISDNRRIENFLTGSSLSTLFSLFNFFIYSVVMVYYSVKIFLVFLVGSAFYVLWISFFMKRRASLDFKRFSHGSQHQSKIIELISGMQEVKLHNAEQQKLWQWENLQAQLYKINITGLLYSTAQNSGSALVNELKNIVITFIAASLVMEQQITLGMMLSISYIAGQLNSPVMDLVRFSQSLQDAKLSLERLNEIHERPGEDVGPKVTHISVPDTKEIRIKNMSYRYEGGGSSFLIEDLSLVIPVGKITAIVGSSGSGKTTLMKILLRFYKPDSGGIFVGDVPLNTISLREWRASCGVVMQDGFIFNETIAQNISMGANPINQVKLENALKLANAHEFVNELPLGYHTKIGTEGLSLSAGQKQRVLIARAIYKDPHYLFLDEATSSLDSTNEKIIMSNMDQFFKNRTVIVIAHRLSTVKNAHQVVVLKGGKVVEVGTHQELTSVKGDYFELVKNQLALGV